MDGWARVLRPFNSISVILRRWKGEHERLCAMKRRLGSGRISPPAGFEPATPRSEVGNANRSATRTLQSIARLSQQPVIYLYTEPPIICEIHVYILILSHNEINHIRKNQDQYIRRRLPKCFTAKGSLLYIWTCARQNQKHDVRPAKTQISLGIRPAWSESSLSARRKLGTLATLWAPSEDSDQTSRIPGSIGAVL